MEDKLVRWTRPSSETEQEKQDRTERMIREAIISCDVLNNCSLKVYAKGSYVNNTNVRLDSDVDIAVEFTDAQYWQESEKGNHPPGKPYAGIWTPAKLRAELIAAMDAKFPGQVDSSGNTAIKINSNSAHVDADVVPCFSYRYYIKNGSIDGTKIFKTDGSSVINYPRQQLENGIAKNRRTGYAYKKGARLLKRIENAMAQDAVFNELPSFFIECLAYNCPDDTFAYSTWTECLKAMLVHVWNNLQGDEPASSRWMEVNECTFLFCQNQKWTRSDGRDFAKAAWNYVGFN
jgi:hypothetical protein